jgi:hypothetical protein
MYNATSRYGRNKEGEAWERTNGMGVVGEAGCLGGRREREAEGT